MKTTLGGDRLGSGNKQEISLKTYNRSTHDLSYLWRSSMASGTLVPFMTELALPGDSFDIELDCEVMTLPTIGPLFGSYKVQLDVFQAPIRLYQGKLHMNKLGIGMDMSKIDLPQLQLETISKETSHHEDNEQINSSSIFSYLNIRGLGLAANGSAQTITRYFNAVPYLAYFEIYKNYYANKQEEQGVIIHNPLGNTADYGIIEANIYIGGRLAEAQNIFQPAQVNGNFNTGSTDHKLIIKLGFGIGTPVFSSILMSGSVAGQKPLTELFSEIYWDEATKEVRANMFIGSNAVQNWTVIDDVVEATASAITDEPNLVRFELSKIDEMRENILKAVSNQSAFIIDKKSIEPYKFPFIQSNIDYEKYSKQFPQEGLLIKTYQSDLFNNWISTEWIDGTNGINEVTKVSTTGESFTIDALNLANKVYNMLNRIAISGGSYDDWLDAVYTHERAKSVESPIYHGSLIKELAFEEVISNAATANEPLGTLAGRGRLTQKNKGGKMVIKVDEPSYIMGIVSITPRVDYSQGNKWDVNLKTMDDLHKPALDEIGYQDLITDQLAWFDTLIGGDNEVMFKSAGKQPAWINYMTNVNQVRGNFAVKNSEMFMVLNRRYENDGMNGINDLTTYIDPSKFNHIFADTRLDAMNFWVQISNNITARRKISAKVIPNL